MTRKYKPRVLLVMLLLGILSVNAALADKSKLTIWLCSNFVAEMKDYYTKVFSSYAQSKGVDLEIQVIPDVDAPTKYAAALEGGSPPDLAEFGTNGLIRYASNNHLIDLSPMFKDLGRSFGGYYPIGQQGVTYHGKQYGIPVGFQAQVWFLRQDLLDKAKLPLPTTWDQLIQTAKKLNDPANGFYGFGQPLSANNDTEQWIRSLMWAYGATVTKKDGETVALDSPAAIKVLEILQDMYKSKIFPPGALSWDGAGNNKAYLTGSAAMIQNAMSLYVQMKTANPELLKNTILLNAMKGPKARADFGAVFAFGVFRKGRNYNLGREALQYLMERKNYSGLIEVSQGYYVPMLKDFTNLPMFEDPYLKVVMEQVKYSYVDGYPASPSPMIQEIYDTHVLVDMVQRVLVDGVAPKKAVEEATARVNRIFGK